MASTRTSILMALTLLSSRLLASAFNFTTPPDQCQNVTVAWTGGGRAPYSLLVVPVGHLSPVETRTIVSKQDIQSTEYTFQLDYPAGSRFVVTLGDSEHGPGSGGTSDVLTVGNSTDSSCLNHEQVKPEYYFYLNPATPTQCQDWQISFPTSHPNTSIWGIVPNGPTFALVGPDASSSSSLSSPSPSSSDTSQECSTWTVDLAAGTQVLLVAGDASQPDGMGKAGSTDLLTVGASSGPGGDASCLSEAGPYLAAESRLSVASLASQTANPTQAPSASASASLASVSAASTASVAAAHAGGALGQGKTSGASSSMSVLASLRSMGTYALTFSVLVALL